MRGSRAGAAGELSGRTALVTGGTGSIGEAVALSLREAGAAVVVTGRSADTASPALAEALRGGDRLSFVAADVSRESSVRALAGKLSRARRAPDILVLCHGVQNRKPFHEFSLAEWNALLSVNLGGVFLACRQFVPPMRERGFGRVVGITSLTEEIGIRNLSAYGAAKGGMAQFLRAVAVEAAADGVTVNLVAPGRIATRMTRELFSDGRAKGSSVDRIPAGRLGTPEDLAGAVRFLASDGAGYVTGQTIVVDGGWLGSGGNPVG